MKKWVCLVMTLVLCICSTGAMAEWEWKNRVEIAVPGGEGGGLDTTIRKFATYLDDILGVDISILNKSSSMVDAYTWSYNAAHDGYVYQFTAPSSIIADAAGLFTAFKLMDEIVPVSGLVQAEGIIFGRVGAPWNNAEEMIAYAKANPGKVTITVDSPSGISGAILSEFEKAAGIELKWIVSGASEGYISVIAGDVDLTLNTWSDAGAYAQSGDLIPLCVMADNRNPIYPDVETTGELGLHSTLGYYRVFTAMRGTPAEACESFAAAVHEAAQNPEWQEWIGKNGMTNDYLYDAETLKAIFETTYNSVQVAK